MGVKHYFNNKQSLQKICWGHKSEFSNLMRDGHMLMVCTNLLHILWDAKLSRDYLVRSRGAEATNCHNLWHCLGSPIAHCPLPNALSFCKNAPSPKAISRAQNECMHVKISGAHSRGKNILVTTALGPFCKSTPSLEAISKAQG